MPTVVGGRYGLGSKEFTPAMLKGIFDHLTAERPLNCFTVGIQDDVSHTSLAYDPDFSTEPPDVVRALFYGLGSDGTVGANKNAIKIIGEETQHFAQGYFVYDSKKAGSVTVSHLRFGPRPIRSTYQITRANFVAWHQPMFLERFDMLQHIVPGGTFLLNSPHAPDSVWDSLPRPVQEQLIDKQLRFYVIDAYRVAHENGMGRRINTVMQVCFFAISGVLPQDEAIAAIKQAIRHTYGKQGEDIVRMNLSTVDQTLAHLHHVEVPEQVSARHTLRPAVADAAPEFVQLVTARMLVGDGDALELNIYYIPTALELTSEQVERTYSDILTAVKAAVAVSVALKLSPFFSSVAHMARRFDEAGANALVLFNRFYQPDIDLERLEVGPRILLSTPHDLRSPLRWIAILYGHIRADLAATSGIHTARRAQNAHGRCQCDLDVYGPPAVRYRSPARGATGTSAPGWKSTSMTP